MTEIPKVLNIDEFILFIQRNKYAKQVQKKSTVFQFHFLLLVIIDCHEKCLPEHSNEMAQIRCNTHTLVNCRCSTSLIYTACFSDVLCCRWYVCYGIKKGKPKMIDIFLHATYFLCFGIVDLLLFSWPRHASTMHICHTSLELCAYVEHHFHKQFLS